MNKDNLYLVNVEITRIEPIMISAVDEDDAEKLALEQFIDEEQNGDSVSIKDICPVVSQSEEEQDVGDISDKDFM